MNSPYSAVVFDLDGTLLDSLADIAITVNLVLAENGFPEHEIPKYRYFVGDGVVTLFERVLPAEVDRSTWVPRCVARFNEVYDQHWYVNTRPYEGIVELIADLRRQSLPLAVLSNKPHAFTVKCVERFFAADDFAVVLGQREGVPKKPDPAGAMDVASRLELAPEQCVYVGDSLVDMQTAVRARMYPVGVLWGFREKEELLAHGAARVISHPSELRQVEFLG